MAASRGVPPLTGLEESGATRSHCWRSGRPLTPFLGLKRGLIPEGDLGAT